MDALRQHAAKGIIKDHAVNKALGEEEKKAGDTYLMRGEFTEAIDWYSKALEKNPENAAFWTARSFALLKSHCCREALLDARSAVQLAPSWHEGYHQLGLVFQEMSMLGYAQTAFQNAKRLCPEFEEASSSLENLSKMLAERVIQQEKLANGPLSLCQSVYMGDFAAVREYLNTGKSLSPEFVTLPHRELFMTPLQVAVLNQYFDIAQFLVDNDILFPENVCDWMVAQTITERKAYQNTEAELKAAKDEIEMLQKDLAAARQDVSSLHGDMVSHALKCQQVQEQLDLLNGKWFAAQKELEDLRMTKTLLERQLADMDQQAKRHELAMKQMEGAWQKASQERDQVTLQVDELRTKADSKGLPAKEKQPPRAWKPLVNSKTDDVEIMEVSPIMDTEAAESDVTRCMQHCRCSHDAFQQALSQMMQARQAEMTARSGIKDSIASVDARATWNQPMHLSVDKWFKVKTDLMKEVQRSSNYSVADIKAVLGQILQFQESPTWAPFRELLSELHAQANQILMMLVAGHITDTGYAAVMHGVMEDLERAIKDEPISIHLINLAEKENDVKKALPKLQERRVRLQESSPRAAEEEYHKQLEIMDGLLHFISLKINLLNVENSAELTKLSTLVTKSSEMITKLKAAWSGLAETVRSDIEGMRKTITSKRNFDFTPELTSKQKTFAVMSQENERKQEELWTNITSILAQISKLQEERTASIQRRLAEIYSLKRKQKMHEVLLDLSSERLNQLEVVESRCAQAEEVTAVLARFVSSYSGKMGKFLKDTHARLRESARDLHQNFYQWFVAWVKDQMGLIQMKKLRLEQLNVLALPPRGTEASPNSLERRQLEKEVADLEATLKSKLALFDSPGRTGQYFNQYGIPFSHPLLLLMPPKQEPPVTPPQTIGTANIKISSLTKTPTISTTYHYQVGGTPVMSYAFPQPQQQQQQQQQSPLPQPLLQPQLQPQPQQLQQQYSAFPGVPVAASATSVIATERMPQQRESFPSPGITYANSTYSPPPAMYTVANGQTLLPTFHYYQTPSDPSRPFGFGM